MLLLGGFALCFLLILGVPFLGFKRTKLKVFVLGIPLVEFVVLTVGQQMETNRCWEAIVPFACCFSALGLDMFFGIRERQMDELAYAGVAGIGCAWSCWISLEALHSGFMGASC